MSLIIGVYVPTGIVISGDSRTTSTLTQQIPNPQAPGQNINVQLSDATHKVFKLFDRLLIDLGALNDDMRAKFIAFMEVRNQFMHNASATTYEKCFSYLQGKEKYILKTYPQPEAKSNEEALEKASHALASEVLGAPAKIIHALEAKITEDVKREVSRQSNEAFRKTIPEIQNILNDYIEELSGKGGEFKVERFKNLGTEVGKIIYQLWGKNFSEIVKREKEEREVQKENKEM